jgi:DNA polymerase
MKDEIQSTRSILFHMNYEDLVVLDFETYYADDYSLSLKQYNTSEYIRDDQFLIHGVGIQPFGHAPSWIAGHDEALRACQVLDLHDRPVVAHHMAFDGFILHEYAGIHCGTYCDTLSMARVAVGRHVKHGLDSLAQLFGLGKKMAGLEDTKNKRTLTVEEAARLGEYCINDVELTEQLFWKMFRYVPEDEMRLIDLTLRMFCDPRLVLDTELAQLALEREVSQKGAAIDAANTTLKALSSSDQFAELLREEGIEPPMKPSPTDPEKQIYAFAKTDPAFRELQAHPKEEVRMLAEARLRARSTINETRAERMLKAGDGYPLPVYLNYAGAHTYRWSGGNKLNFQNLPRKGLLRMSIMAPEEHQLVIFDLSQIEARFVALFCEQMDLFEAFAAGEDVYIKMAARIYNKEEADVTPDERFIGKVCILGMGYGMGWKRLRFTLHIGFMGRVLDISPEFARRIVNTYRAVNMCVVQMWDRLDALLYQMSFNKGLDYKLGPVTFRYRSILLPNGTTLKYPGLTATEDGTTYQSRNGKRYIWGGMLLENIIQALARCVIAEHMLAIDKLGYFVATMTHDEIATIVPNEIVEDAYRQIESIMTTPPSWAPELPLEVEGDYDERYVK